MQAEADRISGLLSVCRMELERLGTARAVVGELTSVYPVRALAASMQDQLDARTATEVRLEQVTGADGVARRRAEPGWWPPR